MIQSFRYSGASGVVSHGGDREIRFAPNLGREPVAFDAELANPLRFREAISALHDVVVCDLRFTKRDKSAYEAWKKAEADRLAKLRRDAHSQAQQTIAAKANEPLPAGFQGEYESARKKYWSARLAYSAYLQKHDPDLWRKLLPCDPVVTVADDVVFFECFSKDESAYGCLSVDRGRGFGPSKLLQLGTTNVDYSAELYEQFQTLRTYRRTRFTVDPQAFTVTTGEAGHQEEKIDLPNGWLRGFLKLQSAMTMPVTRVSLSRGTVYSLLAFLKRNKANESPRALRFELEIGRPPRLVLEPWGKAFDEPPDRPYAGPVTGPIRIWGTRRLLVLARLLPLAESVDVCLLASGLPSFWVVRMGEMAFTLGLSGWTANDWSKGSALDLLAPPRQPSAGLIAKTAAVLKSIRSGDLSTIADRVEEADHHLVSASLRHLANTGQVIYDLAHDVYRYRQIMSQPVGEGQLGPEDAESAGARVLVAGDKVKLLDRQDGPNLMRVLIGNVGGTPVEVMVDPDDRIKRGKCLCGHFKQYGLRNGPCRHMIALRWSASVTALAAYQQSGVFNLTMNRP